MTVFSARCYVDTFGDPHKHPGTKLQSRYRSQQLYLPCSSARIQSQPCEAKARLFSVVLASIFFFLMFHMCSVWSLNVSPTCPVRSLSPTLTAFQPRVTSLLNAQTVLLPSYPPTGRTSGTMRGAQAFLLLSDGFERTSCKLCFSIPFPLDSLLSLYNREGLGPSPKHVPYLL